MSDDTSKVKYLNQRLTRYSPLPVGERLYYECQECGEIVHSMPRQPVFCSCRNVGVDPGTGRPRIRNFDRAFLVYLNS